MTPADLRRLTHELYERVSLSGAEPFRVKAYERLAKAVEALPDDALGSREGLLSALSQVSGIGQGLLATVRELYETGSTDLLTQLRAEIPDSVLELLRVPGLGPQRVRQLWQELHITSPEKLLEAIDRGKLQNLKGWGQTTISRLRGALEAYLGARHLLTYYEAARLWEALQERLGAWQAQVHPTGAFRRALPLIESVELIAPLSLREKILPLLPELIPAGPMSHQRADKKLRLKWVPDEDFGEALFVETGPQPFSEAVQARAGGTLKGLSEIDIFKKANLPYILPEWRDWPDIIDLADKGLLPQPLSLDRIQGTVHVHTTYSDGADTLEAMAEAARAMGWKYLGIADHSARAAYAGGLSVERLLAQAEAIRVLNARYAGAFTLLHGVEADILTNGDIDYEESVWRELDYLVASVHEKLHMTREEATQRLLRAVSSPYVRILGHWTGRLLRGRSGYPIDELAIIEACATYDVAIEFNGNPYRMEIDWQWIRSAVAKGTSIVLTTDAHSVQELAYLRYALPVLQKGLVPPQALLNYQGADVFVSKSRRGVNSSPPI